MARTRLRVGLDANVLIAGIRLPRWPHEVMRAAVRRQYDLVLPEQVVEEAQRHLDREQRDALDVFLSTSAAELAPMPPVSAVRANIDLVRSEKDVPIALALMAARVEVFVTNDRDFTDEGAVHRRFAASVDIMLPPVFLRDVAGWTSEEVEAIRNRGWEDMAAPG